MSIPEGRVGWCRAALCLCAGLLLAATLASSARAAAGPSFALQPVGSGTGPGYFVLDARGGSVLQRASA